MAYHKGNQTNDKMGDHESKKSITTTNKDKVHAIYDGFPS